MRHFLNGLPAHADAGQMNLYLNYAREHWSNPDENPPIGLILCSEHDATVAHYALGNLGNKVLARVPVDFADGGGVDAKAQGEAERIRSMRGRHETKLLHGKECTVLIYTGDGVRAPDFMHS